MTGSHGIGRDLSNRLLMCRPQYFDVSYVINPWTTDNVHRVGYAQAKAQWAALHGLLQDAAQVVFRLEDQA